MRSLLERLEPATYARARLQLGIGGVGTFVVILSAALAIGLPRAMFAEKGGSPIEDAGLLAVWLAGLALLAFPFEVLGGLTLPRAFGRAHPVPGAWFVGWLRGVLATLLVMVTSGTLIVAAGRAGGAPAAIATLALVLLALVTLQTLLAKIIGGLRAVDPAEPAHEAALRGGFPKRRLVTLDALDEGFTGGVAGLPGAESCILPLAWTERLEPRALELLVARRALVAGRGMRALGLFAAFAWTVSTFLVATLLPGGGAATVAEFVTASAWFGLLSFVGLLVLPTPSRAAARAADAAIAGERPDDAPRLEGVLAALDRLQDDEPERLDGVERIFHPIPSLGSRRRALLQPRTGPSTWHLARTAIYLSIAGLNPLHRLVHCNVGRPELWVFLPADG